MECRHDAARIELENAAGGRLVGFESEHGHFCALRTLFMRTHECTDVEVREIIGMSHQERRTVERCAVTQQRPAGAEQARLGQHFDAITMFRGRDKSVHLLREMERVDQNLLHLMRGEEVEPVGEQGTAAHRHETFRNAIGERFEPCA